MKGAEKTVLAKLSYEDAEAAIGRRRWEKIRACWLVEMPTLSPFSRTDQSEISSAADTMLGLGTAVTEGQFTTARQMVFEHAVCWLQKALNVLGGAEVHLNVGYKTWSISSSYQSAFFAARSLLAFLGVIIIEHKGRTFLLDIFPKPPKPADLYSESRLTYVGTRLDHRPLWSLMQRILAITVEPIWPEEVAARIRTMDIGEFARQRNSIHYRPDGWIFPDLEAPLIDDHFAAFAYRALKTADFESDGENTTFLVAFCLSQMSLDVLRDFSTSSNIPLAFINRLRQRITEQTHPKYSAQLLSA